MNKQKTYTVEELHDEYTEWGGQRGARGLVDEFLEHLLIKESKSALSSQENTEESKPCIRCDMGGSKHPHVEEIKPFSIIQSVGTELITPSATQMAQKLNELIWSHNALLKQMKGRQ